MRNFTNVMSLAVALSAVSLFCHSCSEQVSQLEKQQVQFSLRTAASLSADEIDLPDDAWTQISIESKNGSAVFSHHRTAILKQGGIYVTEPLDLPPGAYRITEFIVGKDSVALYLTSMRGAEYADSEVGSLPYEFSVSDQQPAMVSMRVTDVRNQDVEKFGYASSKSSANVLSLAIYESIDGNAAPTPATAELRQNNILLKRFSLSASVNNITLPGDAKAPYSLTVYSSNSAKTETFNLKDLKKQIGKRPFEIMLAPALVLTIHSSVDEGNEYYEYFNFKMDGVGTVTVNWGDGTQSNIALPFETEHEYFSGVYTAFVTGDIHQITNFSGFSYGSIIYAITGLTNLAALRVYDPSWGAVPIKVDLSRCYELQTINIAKYGAPYEPCDLRTDFKLPVTHHINSFTLDAPSFDINREYISAEELDVMFTNIYNNAVSHGIFNGTFLVNPVVAPSAETQQKIDILKNSYGWTVGFNDEIYYFDGLAAGRTRSTSDPNARREEWLREKFANAEKIIQRAGVSAVMN